MARGGVLLPDRPGGSRRRGVRRGRRRGRPRPARRRSPDHPAPAPRRRGADHGRRRVAGRRVRLDLEVLASDALPRRAQAAALAHRAHLGQRLRADPRGRRSGRWRGVPRCRLRRVAATLLPVRRRRRVLRRWRRARRPDRRGGGPRAAALGLLAAPCGAGGRRPRADQPRRRGRPRRPDGRDPAVAGHRPGRRAPDGRRPRGRRRLRGVALPAHRPVGRVAPLRAATRQRDARRAVPDAE